MFESTAVRLGWYWGVRVSVVVERNDEHTGSILLLLVAAASIVQVQAESGLTLPVAYVKAQQRGQGTYSLNLAPLLLSDPRSPRQC